jgi:3-methyladenine DNA glycosylase/8-oxoguanine DNA glycosylase
VYREGEDYQVDTINDKQPTKVYTQQIPHRVVEFLYSEIRGQQVTRKDAASLLAKVVRKFGLPYTHGYKLGYYAQEILIVLISLERATLKKEGKRYLYTVK